MHSHLAKHLMIVNSESHFVRRDADGAVPLDTRAMEPPYIMPPMLWSDVPILHLVQGVSGDALTAW